MVSSAGLGFKPTTPLMYLTTGPQHSVLPELLLSDKRIGHVRSSLAYNESKKIIKIKYILPIISVRRYFREERAAEWFPYKYFTWIFCKGHFAPKLRTFSRFPWGPLHIRANEQVAAKVYLPPVHLTGKTGKRTFAYKLGASAGRLFSFNPDVL